MSMREIRRRYTVYSTCQEDEIKRDERKKSLKEDIDERKRKRVKRKGWAGRAGTCSGSVGEG